MARRADYEPQPMGTLRTFLRRHRELALLLAALALCLKALVPAGFMVASHGRVLTIEVCADASGAQVTRQIVVPAKAGESAPAKAQDGGQACSFAGHGHAGLAAADPVLLALALAFILALGYLPVQPLRLARVFTLRPPLRGPPAIA